MDYVIRHIVAVVPAATVMAVLGWNLLEGQWTFSLSLYILSVVLWLVLALTLHDETASWMRAVIVGAFSPFAGALIIGGCWGLLVCFSLPHVVLPVGVTTGVLIWLQLRPRQIWRTRMRGRPLHGERSDTATDRSMVATALPILP